MESYTYKLCEMMIKNNKIQNLQDKMDLFLLTNRITKEEYSNLSSQINSLDKDE